MPNLLTDINTLLNDFIIVTLLSLIIGLEQRRHHMEEEEGVELLFGTDRTFTFIGILGFILYQIDTVSKILFIGGGIIISILLGIFYKSRIETKKKYGLTSILSALITYCLAPMVVSEPKWFALLIVVVILILTEMKNEFISISKKFDKDEFITLAKFIVIAFVILPNLPDEPLSDILPVSLYKLWLSIVAVSTISYLSYLLRKFVFPSTGVIISGLLGGLYSSTTITLVLARKSNEKISSPNEYASAIIYATSIMYIRVFLLLIIFNKTIAYIAGPYLLIYFLLSVLIGLLVFKMKKFAGPTHVHSIESSQNPLEFKMALLFSVFYLLFAFLSNYSEKYYGQSGLNILSLFAGFADVDAYVMNLAQGKFELSNFYLAIAVLQVTTANNLIKLIYGIFFSEKKTRQLILAGYGIVVLINVLTIIYARF